MFLSVKRAYPGHPGPHRRAVAALEVLEQFESHKQAAGWYRGRGRPVPSNCLVPGNEPLSLDHTAHPMRDLREWDLGYWARTRRNGVFLACRVLFRELTIPPVVTDDDLVAIFGYVPATLNPPRIAAEQFDALLVLAKARSAK